MRLLALALAPALAGCAIGSECDEPGVLCLLSRTATQTRTSLGAGALVDVDVDGDGSRDLVAAGRGTVTAIWGDGMPGAATTWSIDPEVVGLVVADLDGDGRLDLATALPGADAVAVLFGRGGRTFSSPSRYPAGASPRALIAADLDAGGPPELVTANLDDGTVTVLRGFVAGPPQVVGPGPRALAAGDLDGDGDLDLAVALADADAVQVLRGDGRGGLQPGPLHPVGAAPRALVIADLDDDGVPDIATADALDDTLSLLYADGTGSHRARQSLPTLTQPTALATLVDAGRPILAVLSDTTATIARVDPRDGTSLSGTFAIPPTALAPGPAGELHFGSALGRFGELGPGLGLGFVELWHDPWVSSAWPADIDGDGVAEIIEHDGETLSLRRAGMEWVTGIEPGLEAAFLRRITAADLTGDGLRDLVVWSDDELAVLVQQPDGASFIAGPPLPLTMPPRLADVDGDGATDVLTVDLEDTSTRLRWWTAGPAGALAELGDREVVLDVLAASVALVDGDGNGRPDIVLDVPPSQLLYLADAATPPLALGHDSEWELDDLEFIDLDGDGGLDGVGCPANQLTIVRDVLTQSPSAPTSLGEGYCRTVEVVDLDGDGALDLLEQSFAAVTSRTLFTPHLRRGDAWQTLGSGSLDAGSLGDFALARLDADTQPDLFLVDATAGMQAHRFGLVPALVDTGGVRVAPSTAQPCLGDLDGDGATDLVTIGPNLGVAFADGRGGFEPLQRRDIPLDPFGPDRPRFEGCVVADFDGDGEDELVLHARILASQRRTSLVTAEVDRRGGLDLRVVAEVPDALDSVHAADLDADGAPDLVSLTADAELQVFAWRNDGAGRFAAQPTFSRAESPKAFGQLQLGDGDGDGRLDVVAIGVNHRLLVFPGDGSGGFAAGRDLAPAWTSRYTIGDIDRDARRDLAAVNGDSELLFMPGLGGSPRVLLEDIDAVTAADLDRDGRLELLAVGGSSYEPAGGGILYVGRPREDGRLVFEEHELAVTAQPELRIADFDGDGRRDVALLSGTAVTIVRQGP
ncbi:FG-GAP repeat domain-containing protein [Nannocystis radixulma]|uniref:VCBS repeat-containing protein n=1 Tax=Nannocystis radixulma TaxID=2995305 RepID=A0ABT5AZU4_9BACT|nr:VCBS repeat-containing protein [Nannocystis radixulma]MDC0667369.1 VCBS repeat-containing protein [Nannocystis radixulma]